MNLDQLGESYRARYDVLNLTEADQLALETIVQSIHELGLDWYYADKDLCFGKKNIGSDASPRLGRLWPHCRFTVNVGIGRQTPLALQALSILTQHGDGPDKWGRYKFELHGFAKVIADQAFQQVLKETAQPERLRGHWPHAYDEEDDATLLVSELAEIKADSSLTETERAQLILARVGQGAFRDALMAKWNGACALTGLSVRELLRASHIMRWSDCETKEERLDVNNGLLLSANIDCLFEAGLISFDDDGWLLLSDDLARDKDLADELRLSKNKRLRQIPSKEQIRYLEAHRVRHWVVLAKGASDS